jgi:hypothetical protein
MKATFAGVFLLLTLAVAQDNHAPNPDSAALETKIRKVWQDFKVKDKGAVASVLADGFHEMEEGDSGFGNRDSMLGMIDDLELAHFTLTEFRVTPIGKESALVNYRAEYDGKAEGKPFQNKTAYGEVWLRQGADWKLLYVQETTVK